MDQNFSAGKTESIAGLSFASRLELNMIFMWRWNWWHRK